MQQRTEEKEAGEQYWEQYKGIKWGGNHRAKKMLESIRN